MSVTEYVIPLGENARKRHYHETDRGKVIGFVVQLEVFAPNFGRKLSITTMAVVLRLSTPIKSRESHQT